MKVRRLDEEAAVHGLEREYPNEFMTDVYRDGNRDDLESFALGTRALGRGRSIF